MALFDDIMPPVAAGGKSGLVPNTPAPTGTSYLADDGTFKAIANASAATTAQAIAGTSTSTFLTPANLQSVAQAQLRGQGALDYLQSDGATSNRRIETIYGTLGAVAGSDLTEVDYVFDVPTSGPAVNAIIFAWASAATGNLDELAGSLTGILFGNDMYVQQRATALSSDRRYLTYSGFRTAYSGRRVRMSFAFTGNSTTKPVITLDGVDISASFNETLGGGVVPNWMDTTYLTTTYHIRGYSWPAGYFRPGRPVNRKFTQADVDFVQATGRLAASDAMGGSVVAATSGTLTIGRGYRIKLFVAGDSFTNVGAASNATGVGFVATGTTPTTWANSSQIVAIGALSDPIIQPCLVLDDATPNNRASILVGFTPVTNRKDWRIPALVDMSTTGNKQLLAGAVFESPTKQAIDTIESTCAGSPTFSIGDGTTATKYTASVAHTAIRLRETVSANFPADSAKTGLYANVTALHASSTAELIVVRGHRE